MSQTSAEGLLPTEADIAFYREHGWYVSRNIFSDSAMRAAAAAVEHFYAGERDLALPIQIKARLDWRSGDPEPLRLNDHVALMSRRIRSLLDNHLLGETAARLAGTPQVRLFQSSIVTKEPGVANAADVQIGWHTDKAYWQMCSSSNMITAWLPLRDCNAATGGLLMLDGSHRWPATPAVTALRHGNSFLGSDQVVLERELLEAGLQFNPVPIVVERGQVSFHHCLTFHSSGPNLGRHDRTAIIFALQDGANHYRYPVEADERLRSHSNDRMCRTLPDGCPDYSDPAVCPVVWEARRTPRR